MHHDTNLTDVILMIIKKYIAWYTPWSSLLVYRSGESSKSIVISFGDEDEKPPNVNFDPPES